MVIKQYGTGKKTDIQSYITLEYMINDFDMVPRSFNGERIIFQQMILGEKLKINMLMNKYEFSVSRENFFEILKRNMFYYIDLIFCVESFLFFVNKS